MLRHVESTDGTSLLEENGRASAEALDKTPHHLWADYADRGNKTWNQSTSNISESTNSMLGAQSRAKPILPLLMDILMQTASRLDGAANRKGQGRQLVPFAQVTYNKEFKWASEYQVQSYGGGLYAVAVKDHELHGNKIFFDSAAIDDVSCTCGFRKRWGIPCRHMIAVAKYLPGDNSWTLDIIHEGFRLGRYRATAADLRYRIIPPMWDELSSNTNHLPPERVSGQAGRPKGRRRTKRKASNGEYHTHSRYNAVRLERFPPGGNQNSSQGSSAAASQGTSAQSALVIH